MSEISDLNDLRLFAEVVERGSFTAAARHLGFQTSKLSRRVRALEEELGVRLLNRTSRSLSLTETGRQFHQHCLALIAESRAAREAVERTRSRPQGTVRISCPVGLLPRMTAVISAYLGANPDVQVLVDATNRVVDVIEEGLDFAIRVRVPPLEDMDLAVRNLGHSNFILVASPALAQRLREPSSLGDLKDCPTVSMGSKSERSVWNFLDEKGQSVALEHWPRFATDDLASLRVAANVGVGVAMLPREFVEDDLKSGRLVRLLPRLAGKTGLVHAIFPSRRGMVPAVRQLLDALSAGYDTMDTSL